MIEYAISIENVTLSLYDVTFFIGKCFKNSVHMVFFL